METVKQHMYYARPDRKGSISFTIQEFLVRKHLYFMQLVPENMVTVLAVDKPNFC